MKPEPKIRDTIVEIKSGIYWNQTKALVSIVPRMLEIGVSGLVGECLSDFSEVTHKELINAVLNADFHNSDELMATFLVELDLPNPLEEMFIAEFNSQMKIKLAFLEKVKAKKQKILSLR